MEDSFSGTFGEFMGDEEAFGFVCTGLSSVTVSRVAAKFSASSEASFARHGGQALCLFRLQFKQVGPLDSTPHKGQRNENVYGRR